MAQWDNDETETFSGVRCVGETERAIKCVFPSGIEEWIPKSVVHENSEVYEPDPAEGKLVVLSWFAERELRSEREI